jgi:uncharacterized membrane protein
MSSATPARKLVSTNLSAEQEARLRDVFSESTETAEKV